MDFALPDSDVWDSSPCQDKFIESYFGKHKLPYPTVTKKRKRKKLRVLTSNLNEDDNHVSQSVEAQKIHRSVFINKTENVNDEKGNIGASKNQKLLDSGKEIVPEVEISNLYENKKFKNKFEKHTLHSEPASSLQGNKLSSNKKKRKKKRISETGPDDMVGDLDSTNSKHGKSIVHLEKLNKYNKKTLCSNEIKKISPVKVKDRTEAEELSDEDLELIDEVKNSLVYQKLQNFTRQEQFSKRIDLIENFSDSSNEEEQMPDVSENEVQKTLATYSSQSMIDHQTVPRTYAIPSEIKSKSTSFINKAREKLNAAKFRYLNEKLYTESGRDAYEYFQHNVDEFEDYHSGYKMQVQKWPMNPVDLIIKDLQQLTENAVIADMGCGDAKIAQTFTDKTVYSFDLIALNEFVTACDISNVPLSNESVDVVVFCLSLMGTNLKDYLFEGHRILKDGGILKIAEVESRINDLDQLIKCLKCMGFSLEHKNSAYKMFVFLDFKKVKRKIKKGNVPSISLRPCLYKKR